MVGALSQSARAVERRTGVTNAQVFILQQLRSAGPLSVNELAARARTGQSAASIVIARVVAAGLARKGTAEGDARRVTVSLTTKGRTLLRRAPRPPTGDLLRAIESLPAGDARALAAGLRALVRALHLESRAPALLFEPSARSTRTSHRPRTVT